MAEEQGLAPNGPQGAEEELDYKELYEKAKANSRKWEERAKANKSAAEELERANEAGRSAEERIADLTRRLDEKERAEERARIAADVASRKGVDASLLVGETQEEMEAWADKLLAAFKKPAAPSVRKPGSFAAGDGKEGAMRDYARALLG